MKKEKLNSGLAIHCHHDILVDYCYDFNERVEYIKKKPENEVKTRLRLFKLLPKEAEKDIPSEYVKASRAWAEAYKAWDEADKAWDEADKGAFHKKWCGCKEQDGKKLIFNPQ